MELFRIGRPKERPQPKVRSLIHRLLWMFDFDEMPALHPSTFDLKELKREQTKIKRLCNAFLLFKGYVKYRDLDRTIKLKNKKVL